MSKLLNQAQAEAVYSAMCALNNVGCDKGHARISGIVPKHDVNVTWGIDRICVEKGAAGVGVDREVHADQAAFVAAYNLNPQG